MPVKVYKTKSGYTVKDSSKSSNKKGRTHKTKTKAMKQMRAINLNLKRKGKI